MKKADFNPETNHEAIAIVKQEDGNYIGYAWKFGKLVSARQADPQMVLQLLLTHNGKDEPIVSI